MNKFIIYIFLFVLSINFCLAETSTIKISPIRSEINFSLNNDPTCVNITILPVMKMNITTLWSKNDPGIYETYNLSNKNVKINAFYKQYRSGINEICFEPKKSGLFYGIIIFHPENKNTRIISWININSIGADNQFERISLITGNAIKSYHVNTTNVWLTIILLLLLTILSVLIFRIRKSLKNKHS